MYNLFLRDILGEKKSREILDFPIMFDNEDNYCRVLSNRLQAYFDALEVNIDNVFNKVVDPIEIDKDQAIYCLKKLINGIKKCLDNYCSGNQFEAYKVLFEALDILNRSITLSSLIKEMERGLYYRIRKNTRTNNSSDLYHISFNKIYLCKDDRFNIKGYPCLYLSCKQSGCKKEMNYTPEDTIASFNYKGEKLRLLDLTSGNKYHQEQSIQNDQENILMHILWPLIAACYGVCRDNSSTGNDYSNKQRNFKIEYVISQMFAEYIHYHLGLDGIIYYTVRNEHLNPVNSDMKNIVLFTNHRVGEEYDYDLLKCFDINIDEISKL